MTCRSDDPWEIDDDLARKHMKIAKRIRYLACFTFAAALLFLIVLMAARCSPPMKVPQWRHAIEAVKRQQNTQ